jgi:hypothetical protein
LDESALDGCAFDFSKSNPAPLNKVKALVTWMRAPSAIETDFSKFDPAVFKKANVLFTWMWAPS